MAAKKTKLCDLLEIPENKRGKDLSMTEVVDVFTQETIVCVRVEGMDEKKDLGVRNEGLEYWILRSGPAR